MQLRIKQGATFMVTITARDAAGAPLNLAAATLATTLADALGAPMAGLGITATGNPGEAVILADALFTAAWPVGLLHGDIKIAAALTIITDSYLVMVERAVTV